LPVLVALDWEVASPVLPETAVGLPKVKVAAAPAPWAAPSPAAPRPAAAPAWPPARPTAVPARQPA
ncbi:MAG TPA: hypothetical protein VNT52_02045, partial [Acidimicrobiales bacterium]|nr:hypothetical protein [Acidimicrobiales bacterium]